MSPVIRIASSYLNGGPSILARLQFVRNDVLSVALEIQFPEPGAQAQRAIELLETARRKLDQSLPAGVLWQRERVDADSVSVTGRTPARRLPKGRSSDPKLPSVGWVESKVQAVPGVYNVFWR